MNTIHITILAAVQGITEFLPISSSAHLILIPEFTGWVDQGLGIDVAVHIGTLGAIIIYFWKNTSSFLIGFYQLFIGTKSEHCRLALNLLIASAPTLIVGALLMYFGATDWWRNAEVIGWTMLVFGALLFVADRWSLTAHQMTRMSVKSALLIGVAQIAALIPGTSRSGITITAARLLGFQRDEAARFSMLLSIPTILAAGTVIGYELTLTTQVFSSYEALLAGLLSFLFALLTISALMIWLRRRSFTPFVIYRIVFGAGLLFWVYF